MVRVAAPRRFILLVVGLVVVAGAVMLPRRDEWLAVMRDEDKQAQIISLLEPRLAAGDDEPELLATLGRSYGEVGNYRRAIELLERYVALRSDDGEAYARLADLYRQTGDDRRRVAMLERSVSLLPKVTRAIELADLHRERQRPDREVAALSRAEAGATLENGLWLRLAHLRAAAGDVPGAIQTLERPEVVSTWSLPSSNGESRLFLAELLVQSGRSVELARLGRDWIQQWREPWLDNRLLSLMALRAPAEAADLAQLVGALHPVVRFYIAHGLHELGASLVARRLLETWVAATPSPSMNDVAAFLTACREQDAEDVVWRSFEDVLRHPTSNEIVGNFSEAIAAEFGLGALAPFWPRVAQAVGASRPLLAARFAFAQQDIPSARWLLGQIDPNGLDASSRRMWINLLQAVATPQEAYRALQERRRNGQLPPELTVQYARLAGQLGDESGFRAAVADLRRSR
ncbi:MAG TPA: hypothetical protein VFL55_26815 [Acetobacteraceae bacterium]|nr:hypothetical protein [Acetobacteraceae bacterium]